MLNPALRADSVSTRYLASWRMVARVGPLGLAAAVVLANVALALAGAISFPLIALAVILVPLGLLTLLVASRHAPLPPSVPPMDQIADDFAALLHDAVAQVDGDYSVRLYADRDRPVTVVLLDGVIHVVADPEVLALTAPTDVATIVRHLAAVAALERELGVERAGFEAGGGGRLVQGGNGVFATVINAMTSLFGAPLRHVVARCRADIDTAVRQAFADDIDDVVARQRDAGGIARDFHLRFVEPLRYMAAAVPDLEVGLRCFAEAIGARPGASLWPNVRPATGGDEEWRALFGLYVERLGSRAAVLNKVTGRRSDLRLSPADIAGWPLSQREHAARQLGSELGGVRSGPLLMRAAVADALIVHLRDAGIGTPEFSWAGPVALRHDGALIDVDAWAERVLAGDATPPDGTPAEQ